jgi:hypothetical protein
LNHRRRPDYCQPAYINSEVLAETTRIPSCTPTEPVLAARRRHRLGAKRNVKACEKLVCMSWASVVAIRGLVLVSVGISNGAPTETGHDLILVKRAKVNTVWHTIRIRVNLGLPTSTKASRVLAAVVGALIKKIKHPIRISVHVCRNTAGSLHMVHSKTDITDPWASVIAIGCSISV